MPVQALTQVDPNQFFNLLSTNGTGTQRLDTQVSGVAVSNDFTGRLSVTTAEGDTITLSADLESDFRAVNYKSHVEGDLNEQELKDLAKLFRKVANTFKKYLNGQDDEALAKTAKLAERFGKLSSLSGLDLSVDVERSVTVLAAQVALEVTGQPALPPGQQPQTPATTSHTATPGGAPSTAAAIPQPSTGTTVPTQPSTDAAAQASDTATRLVAPAQDASRTKSLVQQVLDALDDTRVESHKVHKYLPDFLKKLREDLRDELRGNREQTPQTPTAGQSESPATTVSSVLFAYQAVSLTSVSLSIRT